MLHEIDADLITAEKTLSLWGDKYPDLVRKEMNTNVTYEMAFKAAYDRISKPVEGQKAPTVDAINSKAALECEKEYRAYREAKAEMDIAKKLIGIAETTLSSIQTRAKLSQIEMGLAR